MPLQLEITICCQSQTMCWREWLGVKTLAFWMEFLATTSYKFIQNDQHKIDEIFKKIDKIIDGYFTGIIMGTETAETA